MGRVLVAGSANVDLIAEVARLPAPGETITATNLRRMLGGKGANQATAAARYGAPVVFACAVGDDADGSELLGFLHGEGITTHARVVGDARTGTALIAVGEEQNTIVVFPGANASLTEADVEALSPRSDDVLLAQLETPLPAVVRALERARAAGARTVLNASPAVSLAHDVLELADVLIVNEPELAAVGGSGPPTDVARGLRARGSQTVIVTMGARGALLVEDEVIKFPARDVSPVVDPTGAGDCFAGVFAAAMLRESSLADAVRVSTVAASLSIGRPGAAASMPFAVDVAHAM